MLGGRSSYRSKDGSSAGKSGVPEWKAESLSRPSGGPPAARPIGYVPALLFAAGETTAKRFITFFTDNIRNPNTRRAYHRAICRFFEWAEAHGLSFERVESYHVSAYVEERLLSQAKASVKQELAAIRMLYDWLIISGVVPNCAVSIQPRRSAGPSWSSRKEKRGCSRLRKPATCWTPFLPLSLSACATGR